MGISDTVMELDIDELILDIIAELETELEKTDKLELIMDEIIGILKYRIYEKVNTKYR